MRKALAAALIGSLIWPVAAHALVRVTGKLYGADGKPAPLAHVHVVEWDGDLASPQETVTAGADGAFRLVLGQGADYQLLLTAVGHENTVVPLLGLANGDSLYIGATLAPLIYRAHPENVSVVGDWNKFDVRSALPMTVQKDGVYTVDVEASADTLAYQLVGICDEGRAVNGFEADHFVYDGAGDYESVLKVKPGKVTLRFDPRELPRQDSARVSMLPMITFDPAHRGFAEVAEAWGDAADLRADFQRAADEYRRTGAPADKFTYAGSPVERRLATLMKSSANQTARELAAAALIMGQGFRFNDEGAHDRIAGLAANLPGESRVWGMRLFPSLVPEVSAALPADKRQALLVSMAEHNPDHTVRAIALTQLVMAADDAGDQPSLRKYYAQLKTGYGDVKELAKFFTEYDPELAVRAGKPVPDFEVTSLDGAEKISNRSLAGKYYLMDFWATWCKPCVGEMAGLQAAWDKYSKRGLVIVSFSFDRAPDNIAKFRAGQWKMPWKHSFVSGGFQSHLAQTFEVNAIPKPVLVGPDGKILAVGNSLRGPGLDAVLERYLKN